MLASYRTHFKVVDALNLEIIRTSIEHARGWLGFVRQLPVGHQARFLISSSAEDGTRLNKPQGTLAVAEEGNGDREGSGVQGQGLNPGGN